MKTLYSELASLVDARKRCEKSLFCQFCKKSIYQFAPQEGNPGGWKHWHSGSEPICNFIPEPLNAEHAEWFDKHEDRILALVKEHMPNGSGFDSGTKIDFDASHAEKLVFETSFHHMNDNGYYDGWTEHTVTVTPSFQGINLRISGRNRNDIKEYIHEQFEYALTKDITYYLLVERFPQFKVTSKWEEKDGSASQCYQAWYVGEHRFWNDPDGAIKFAAAQMEAAR